MALLLDNYRIAVRERSMTEIMDLALPVLRATGAPLVVAFVLGAAPMMLVNYLLLSGMIAEEFYVEDEALGYVMLMSLLVVMQTPLATAPATLYLGQWMFHDRPNLRQIARELLGSLPQILVFQGLLRLLLLPCMFFLVPLAIPFVVWPYLNEVILLERNPLFSRGGRTINTWARSWALHKHHLSDLFARWLAALCVGLMLVFSVSIALWLLISMLTGFVHGFANYLLFYLPLSMWIATFLFTVVRFLCYLDLRIRREGWELDLVMRAEAGRLVGQTS